MANAPYVPGGFGQGPQGDLQITDYQKLLQQGAGGGGAGAGGNSGGGDTGGGDTGIMGVRSYDELAALAASQIGDEITSAEAPLKSGITDLQGREKNTLQQIGTMFGTLMPFVQGGAQNVQNSYDTAFNAAQSIFNAAQTRMNQFKQDRAAQAQAMAQEVGGPVAVGEFTAAALPAEQELASVAPNSLIHMLTMAQAGVQEANAFSQRVFPLVQTEQEANARNTFESQIKDLNDQINTLEGSKQGKINDRLNSLLADERTFAASQAQQKLDQLKADRDWQATQKSLTLQQQRDAEAKKEFAWQKAYQTGQLGLQKTSQKIQVAKLNQQAANQAARLGLDKQSLLERMRHNQETEKVQQQRANNNSRSNAMSLVQHAMSPTTKGTVTLNVKSYIDPKTQPLLNMKAANGTLKDAHWDSDKQQWYVYNKKTLTNEKALAQGIDLGGNTPVSDPQKLFNLLKSASVPSAIAISVIRNRTGIMDFTPGQDPNYNSHTLAGMSNADLHDLAKARGFKADGHVSRNVLVNYIMAHNPDKLGG